MIAYAAEATPQDFQGFVRLFLEIINLIIPVLIALSLLVFFKGLVSFIAHAGSEAEVKKGRNLIVWGLISLFVMVSIYGILAWMQANFGFSTPFHNVLPLLPTR